MKDRKFPGLEDRDISLQQSRRVFCKTMMVMIPATTISLPIASAAPSITPDAVQPSEKTLESYRPVYFKEEEWRFIIAACDLLIPSDSEGPGALETNVPIFIDRQLSGGYGLAERWYMDGPFSPDAAPDRGYQLALTPQQVYRRGIAAADRYCSQTFNMHFSKLTKQQQHDVLKNLEKGNIEFTDVPAATFFSFLLQNTKEGYFSDPVHGGNKDMQSWKMIGYPGARASYLEWVEKYNVIYPLGPVSISGATSA